MEAVLKKMEYGRIYKLIHRHRHLLYIVSITILFALYTRTMIINSGDNFNYNSRTSLADIKLNTTDNLFWKRDIVIWTYERVISGSEILDKELILYVCQEKRWHEIAGLASVAKLNYKCNYIVENM